MSNSEITLKVFMDEEVKVNETKFKEFEKWRKETFKDDDFDFKYLNFVIKNGALFDIKFDDEQVENDYKYKESKYDYGILEKFSECIISGKFNLIKYYTSDITSYMTEVSSKNIECYISVYIRYDQVSFLEDLDTKLIEDFE